MNNTAYNNYRILKEKLDYAYKGYNLKYLIPGYMGYVFDGISPSWKDVAKSFLDTTQSIDLQKAVQSSSPVVISYLIERQDYHSLAEATKNYYPDAEIIALSSLPIKKISIFSLSYIKYFWKSIFLSFNRIDGNIKDKLKIAAILLRLFNQITLLEKHVEVNNITKTYICFNSAYREEALLTEYFNKRKAETITLQHGIFCNYKLLIPFDIINFENMQAQKVLCWGQSAVDFLTENGIDKSRLILLGNPKYKGIKIGEVHQTFKHCLVLLGRGLYIQTNDRLLEMLTEYNRRHNNEIIFYIKKHPFLLDSDHKQYADVNNNMIFLGREHAVEEILKSSMVDFSIAVNTTAYYESLALGKPCLRWTESENEEFYGMDDKVASLSEFEEKIDMLKAMPQSEIKNEMQNVIRYIFNPDL